MLMRIDAHGTPAILSRRAALLAALGLAACKREATHQRVDPALAPLIPAGTTTLIGVRVDNLRKTPAWAKLSPMLNGLSKRTGLDVAQTVHEVVYCLGGKHRAALIRGKFVDGGPNNSGIEPQLKLEGAQKFPYKTHTLIGQEEFAATFFNESVVVAGRASALRAVIDGQALKHAVPEDLLAMATALPPEAYIYAVSNKPAIPEAGIAGVRSLPLTLKTATGYFDLRTAAALRIEAVGQSPADAQKLAEGIKAMVGLFRMTLKPAQTDMLAILDGLHYFQDGDKVKVDLDLPLDAALKLLEGLDISGSALA